MEFTDYSLQKLAQGYLLQSQNEAAMRRLVSVWRTGRRGIEYWNQFALLLRSWLRLTSLLVRYPANPARINAILVTIGFPPASVARNKAS